MDAIFSDVHGNMEALEAVMGDLDRRSGVDRIICLGDTVGYGPNPAECLALVRKRCQVVLLGNHEFALMNDIEGFNPMAAQAILWTRRQMSREDMQYIGTLKSAWQENQVIYVHGSVRDSLMDYVREADSYTAFRKLVDFIRREFRQFEICFTGHNHRAFLGTEEGFIYPHELMKRFHLKGERLYVCVGSVGQPRDDDPRASYCLYDGECVEYFRVPYDINKTAEKIKKAGLHEFLGERLFVGM
jgi:diadenosine tetraphosphatase ApaH/serine/threonine PP2A family protein phosphatase